MAKNNNQKKKQQNSIFAAFKNIKRKPKILPDCMQTIQSSIPIFTVHEKENLIETYPGCYTKTYVIENINYQTASENEQDMILTKWRAFLNSLGTNMEMQLTMFNRNINMREFEEEILLKQTGDDWDDLRDEMNKVQIGRIMEGNNGITKDQFVTLSVHTDNVKKAAEVFKRLDGDIDKHLKTMQSSAKVVPIEERLEILHDIYNIDNRGEFLIKTRVLGSDGKMEDVSSFDFDNIRSMGLSVNDIIAPSSIVIKNKSMEIGNQYACVLRVTELPAILSDNFLVSMTDMPFNMLTTLTLKPFSNADTDKLINQQIAFIREEKNNLQKQLRKNNADESAINPQLLEREEEVLNLRDEIRKNDEHLFEMTLSAVVFAPNETLLTEYTDTVISECKKSSVQCDILTDMQEEGFISTLPLCCNPLPLPRTLKSSSCAVMIPFSNLEVNEKGGIVYTMNAVSKNLIRFNIETKMNYNSFILGSSGSGKSFTVKQMILNLFLSKPVDIIILDPEAEYTVLTQALGGQVFKIQPGGTNHLNPLDITSLEYDYDGSSSTATGDIVDPILEKVSFILNLFEAMLNKTWGMDSIQKTLIDDCLRELYAPFMKNGRLYRVPSLEETPTLNDMMKWMSESAEPEARELYFLLRRYAGDGTLNVFAQQTNIEVRNRIVCFDLSAVGEELKLMSMSIIQDMIWSRLVENRRIGKMTYIIVDEIHVYFSADNTSSAQFLATLYKRGRKYGACNTGITQNPKDMLEHPIGKKLLSESNMIQVLNQIDDDNREKLKSILNISDSMLSYITNVPPGMGLFFTGQNTVPFYSKFPKVNADGTPNKIYPLLTSNAAEIAEMKERERREKLQKQADEKKNKYN